LAAAVLAADLLRAGETLSRWFRAAPGQFQAGAVLVVYHADGRRWRAQVVRHGLALRAVPVSLSGEVLGAVRTVPPGAFVALVEGGAVRVA
jgi:hypothetical protein